MRSPKRKIALLAYLSSLNPSYSVAGVVADQLNLLSKYEDVIFITTDDFTDQDLVPKNVEIRYYPRYTGSTEEVDEIQFEQYVFNTSCILNTCLKDCTHCIQHDLLFIHSFLPMNWAIREVGKRLPKLKWLHWQHSAPSKKPIDVVYPKTGCYMGMDNSTFIYLNRTDITRVAEMYSIPENSIAIVHNFLDLEKLFKVHPLTSELIQAYNLFNADTICVYPTRLVEPKQPDKLIKLMNYLSIDQNVKLIICNSYSNAQKEKDYLEHLKSLSYLEDNLIFTSEFKSKWATENNYDLELGVPREVVSDLMRLADLFVLPSISECCSMIMLEAGANKNLMVLNEDLWSLHQFGGQKMNGQLSHKAIYASFGSITRPVISYNPSEDAWYEATASTIRDAQLQNQAINFFKDIRKRHNPYWVYTNLIKPLF